MFEKEAEEYFENECLHSYADTEEELKEDVVPAFQKGAEFGYKLAHEEIDYLNKHWRSEEERKANEWHYVKDGDYPKDNKQYLVLFYYNYKGKKEMSCGVRDNLHSDFAIHRGYTEQIIAWKEIVLPKLPTELSKKWVDNYEDYQNASNDITFSQYPVYRGK